jgi:hypothetical protein
VRAVFIVVFLLYLITWGEPHPPLRRVRLIELIQSLNQRGA